MSFTFNIVRVLYSLVILSGFISPSLAERPQLCDPKSPEVKFTRPVLSGTVQYVVSANFRVHYSLSGRDATTLSFAQNISDAAEHALSVYTSLGWLPPPPDRGHSKVNPDNLYDIFVIDMDQLRRSTSSAVCRAESLCTDPYPDGSTSWIEIDRDFDDAPWVPEVIPADTIYRAIVAHEVHHAIQNRYKKFPARYPVGDPSPHYDSLWFYENTSYFIEHVAFPDIDVLSRYHLTHHPSDVLNPLNIPSRNIDWMEFQVSGAMWPMFLYEYYCSDCLRRVWEKIGSIPGPHIMSKIDAALRQYYASSLAEALREYAVWRFFTGERADTYHFRYASSWPTSVILRTNTSYPSTHDQDVYYPVGPGGTNFVVFSGEPKALQFIFNATEAYHWAVTILGHKTNTQSYEATFGLDSFASVSTRVLKEGTEYLVLTPVNVDTFLTVNPTYFYHVTTIKDTSVTGTIRSGWNMLSSPTIAENSSAAAMFPALESDVLGYTSAGYDHPDSIFNGRGYWAGLSADRPITYTGAPFDIMWVPVTSGWNLVGALYKDMNPGNIVPSRGISFTSRYQYFNGTGYDSLIPGAPQYIIHTGKGYWVKMSGQGYLTYNTTIPPSQLSLPSIDRMPPPVPALNTKAAEGGRSDNSSGFSLAQCSPNPFNPTTTISYVIPVSQRVTLSVYNLLGQEVVRLVDGIEPAGHKSVVLNAVNLESGIYFYRLTAGEFVETKKMIVVK